MVTRECNCEQPKSWDSQAESKHLTSFRNHHEKTIEGDLFSAFVAAGAISKANADDPKKSSLIRCARTDKGVHAAGNLISLKLIVEDPDIVTKINEKLSPQIRVWGIERTNGSFSAYQFCDSRIYEYLIPTHCFIPPHPKSFLGKTMVELAQEADDLEGYLGRQKEVADVWSGIEEKYVKPVIEEIDPTIRELVLKVFNDHDHSVAHEAPIAVTEEQKQATREVSPQGQVDSGIAFASIAAGKDKASSFANMSKIEGITKDNPSRDPSLAAAAAIQHLKEPSPLEIAIRLLKTAHIKAKKAHRIHPERLARVRSALSRYVGTHKYHNYTVDKSFKDPSAIRIIKTFTVSEKPIIINDTEWLSLKVHGQSFMMHQIRKMVSMVALIIRCGCHEGRLQDSWEANRISIPKAPSLGLLLERPVFDAYNERLEQFGRERIDFGRYEKEMEEFKQREIYERIFREEERGDVFHGFFNALDNTRSAQLFYLSSVGVEATKREVKREGAAVEADKVKIEDVDSDDDGGGGDGEEG